jgi:hypothetical protein
MGWTYDRNVKPEGLVPWSTPRRLFSLDTRAGTRRGSCGTTLRIKTHPPLELPHATMIYLLIVSVRMVRHKRLLPVSRCCTYTWGVGASRVVVGDTLWRGRCLFNRITRREEAATVQLRRLFYHLSVFLSQSLLAGDGVAIVDTLLEANEVTRWMSEAC